MDQLVTGSIDRAVTPGSTILEALGVRSTVAGVERLMKVQALERTVAALRAENLALRIHLQELERLIVALGEEAPGEAAASGRGANGQAH